MAYYEYYCKNCRVGVAAMHGMNEKFKGKCKHCGKEEFEQIMFAPALKFTGTGFYETDSKVKKL